MIFIEYNFTRFIDDDGIFYFHVYEGEYFEDSYTPSEWFKVQYNSKFCLSQCFTVPWGKLYKAHLYDGIVYPENRPVEDDFTTWKVYLRAKRISFRNEALYIHRKTNSSVTGAVNPVYTFPLESVSERITALSLLGFDISDELNAYRFRMGLHKDWLLQTGNIKAYKDILWQEALLAQDIK